MKSNIMKYISYAVLACGLVGSIIGGAVFQTYNFEKQKFVFNIELTIISIIMVLLLFVVFFTLSTVLEKLETLEKIQIILLNRNDKTIKNKTKTTNSLNVSPQSQGNMNALIADNNKLTENNIEEEYNEQVSQNDANYEKFNFKSNIIPIIVAATFVLIMILFVLLH